MFIAESYMSEVADRLGMPVEKFREINFYKDEEPTHFNQPLTDWHVPLMYKQVQDESAYGARREAIAEFNAEHKWRKRGLAIIPTKFGISFTGSGSTRPARSCTSTTTGLCSSLTAARRWVKACTPR
jgi:xanthine dehydrogenase/oxidase